jgi:hypothetical protein
MNHVLEVSADWLTWMEDFETVADELVRSMVARPSDADAELQSVRFALYGRALTHFGTAKLLAETNRLLDLRCVCRNVIECTMHMDAAEREGDYVQKLKDDEKASRRSRARAFARRQPPIDPEGRELLNEFLQRDIEGAKRLQPNDLAKGSEFPRLAHVYREVSADAAHVSIASLERHFHDDANGTVEFNIDPSLTPEELHETITTIALSLLTCTLILVRNLTDFNDAVAFDRLLSLQTRYKSLNRLAAHAL